MAKLIIKLDNEVVDHIELKQGDMKVGRRPGSDIFIDNLAVSGEHANIFTIGEDSFIQDLNSTNGTFINNKKITKHHLRNGDAVSIGKHTLIYMNDKAPAEKAPDFTKTVIINPAAMREAQADISVTVATPEPPAAKTPTAPKPDLHGELVILSGPISGRRIELTKTVTSLGKTGKRSGSITRTNDGYLLEANEGGEAPKLNGRAVTYEGIILKNGDVIEVAGTRLQFFTK